MVRGGTAESLSYRDLASRFPNDALSVFFGVLSDTGNIRYKDLSRRVQRPGTEGSGST